MEKLMKELNKIAPSARILKLYDGVGEVTFSDGLCIHIYKATYHRKLFGKVVIDYVRVIK